MRNLESQIVLKILILMNRNENQSIIHAYRIYQKMRNMLQYQDNW